MRFRPCVFGAIGLAVAAGWETPARAVVTGTQDDFQDATVMNWGGGTTISNSPGGQGGDDDLFLVVTSNGASSGTGSKLAAHNSDSRWIGDYIGAGVNAIQADMLNLGSTTLDMRLVLFSGGDRWTSTNFVLIVPGTGWKHATFLISPASLTEVLGTGSYAADISTVNQIMFRHDGTAPSSGGESITGSIGIDNITAVPGPGAGALIGLAGVCVGTRRRRSAR